MCIDIFIWEFINEYFFLLFFICFRVLFFYFCLWIYEFFLESFVFCICVRLNIVKINYYKYNV